MTASVPLVPLESLVDEARPITYGIVLPGPDAPGGVPYVRVVDMLDGGIRVGQLRRTTAEIAHSYRRSAIAEGDLLVSIRGHVGRTAFVPRAAAGANLTQDTARVALQPSVDRRYVRWYLESPAARAWMAQYTKGVAVTGINLGDLRKLPVPLPSANEQRRVADIIDKADAIRRKRKEAITLTEELLRSTFMEMFGDPVTNPKGWQTMPFGDVVDRFEAGLSCNGEPRTRSESELGVLKISAVTSGYFRPDEHKAVNPEAVQRSLVTPRRGDLLFSRANTRELVAATCLVEDDYPKLFLPDKLWRIVPGPKATTEYLRFLLANERQRRELTQVATGTSGSMLNISMEKLRRAIVPVAPMPLQAAFSRLLWSTLAIRRRASECASQADRLVVTIQYQAFGKA